MPLKIELNKGSKKITWDDLEYGDVFETNNGIAMKVCNHNNKEKDYILFLDDFDIYTDVENYKIIKTINCKLVKE